PPADEPDKEKDKDKPKEKEKPQPRPKAEVATYWLGRQPDPAKNVFVFDVPVPADLASVITCDKAEFAKFRPGVHRFQWEAEGKVHVVIQSNLGWHDNSIERGRVMIAREGAFGWAGVSTKSPQWPACKAALAARATGKGWDYATPRLLAV